MVTVASLPRITKQQQTILTHIYTFRCLNRIQIQYLLKHKGPRRINGWLKDLVEKKYLTQKYSRRIGDNIEPAIYHLGNNGIRWVRKNSNCTEIEAKKLYSDKHRSILFFRYRVAVMECLLLFHRTVIKQHEQGRIDYYMYEKLKAILDLEETIPSLYVVPLIPQKKLQRFFVQVFPAYLPQFMLKKQLSDLLSLLDIVQEDTYSKIETVKNLMLICTTYRQQVFLLSILQEEIDTCYAEGSVYIAQAKHLRRKTFDQVGWIIRKIG